jgi:hypothetical protein
VTLAFVILPLQDSGSVGSSAEWIHAGAFALLFEGKNIVMVVPTPSEL